MSKTFELPGDKQPMIGAYEARVCYCYYCGKQAQSKDIGDRYEIEWAYFCDCEGANEEGSIQGEIRKLKYEIHTLEMKLNRHMSVHSPEFNLRMANAEIQLIKKKYGVE